MGGENDDCVVPIFFLEVYSKNSLEELMRRNFIDDHE